MSMDTVQNCQLDDMPLMGLQECMNNYGVTDPSHPDPDDPHQEWTNNCLSSHTVAYTCGMLSRQGDGVTHNHHPAELERCRELALAAAEIMDGIEVGMGTEASDVFFSPFYVTANIDQAVPAVLDEALIRSAFGGTIYPPAKIEISPLVANGRWWELLDDDYEGYPEALVSADRETLAEFDADEQAEFKLGVEAWQALVDWFEQQPHLSHGALVEIGVGELSDHNMGCVFPRLLVGLTSAGSLVGLAGYVVQT